MKFDFIIGNPPYQDDVQDSDNKTFMPPIYNLFMDGAYEISDRVELIHPARFLFNAGQTPKAWNEKMLNDPHFRILHYEQDASKVFPNTYINGGVVISYHSALENFGRIGTFTAFNELNSILQKTQANSNGRVLGEIVFNQNRFLLDALYQDYPMFESVIGSNGRDRRFRNNIFDKISVFTDEKTEEAIRILGIMKGKRVWKYIPQKYVDLTHENLQTWKIVISSADGAAGTVGHPIPARILGEPSVLAPMEGYTQTFIGIGSFDLKEQAENAAKYIRTKFCRTLAGILKITQHITPDTFAYVPLQDFTSASDIDWKKPISDIDEQLCKKYGFDQEEINFIESHVKEMA